MKPKIGLEIHGYLLTKEKLFCRCSTDRKAKPNTNICPVCTGQPGSKPLLPNKTAMMKVAAIAMMLNCKISNKVIWQRKHYDWPDLPKGYQDTISGAFSIPVGYEGEFLDIRIRECHLEEDPAKWNPDTGEIDYNRAGLPLIEIVTEPDFSSAKQVREWLKKLILTLSYIKALDRGAGVKADVNVSIDGKNEHRVEVKNVNSFSNIMRVVEYELARQRTIQREGKLARETRAYSETKKITIKMREKEQEADYKFIPDPDLPVIDLRKEEKEIEKIKKSLPETMHNKIKRFMEQYRISEYSAGVLAKNLPVADFFEEVVKKIPARIASEWVTIELLRILNYNKKNLEDVDIKPEHFSELIKMVAEKKITELKAKEILNKFIPRSFSPVKGIKQESKLGEKEITGICKKILQKEKKASEDYKSGKKEALNFLIGQVVKESRRRADSEIIKKIILKLV